MGIVVQSTESSVAARIDMNGAKEARILVFTKRLVLSIMHLASDSFIHLYFLYLFNWTRCPTPV